MKIDGRGKAIIAVLLAVGSFLLYRGTASFGFLMMDDQNYLVSNPVVRRGLVWDGVVWAFSTFRTSNWHPLTWISHMADVSLFGMAPGGHHLVNAGLHAVNGAILFLALARMTGEAWKSAAVALLFAVHPYNVESVAWVAERKNLLSALFGFAALLAYAGPATRSTPVGRVCVAVLFVLGLLAKPMVVILPVLLLLCDHWPLRRDEEGSSLGRLVAEKSHLFLFSLLSAAVTVAASADGGTLRTLDAVPPSDRIANAVVAYLEYLRRLLVPVGFSPFHPQVRLDGNTARVLLSLGVMAGVSAWILVKGRARRFLVVGWTWFLVSLLPVIGIVQVASQGAADRYMYLPMVGPLIVVVWGTAELLSRWRMPRWGAFAVTLSAAAMLAGTTVSETGHWKDDPALMLHAWKRAGGEVGIRGLAAAESNRGARLAEEGEMDAAERCFREAIRLAPRYAGAHFNLGILLRGKGDAVGSFRELSEAGRLGFDPEAVRREIEH